MRGQFMLGAGPFGTPVVPFPSGIWQVRTATAVAPVVAIPTTTALLSLWNGEATGGKTYFVDSVYVLTVASTAAAQVPTVLGMVNKALQAAIANTLTVAGLRAGAGVYATGGGLARGAVNTTVTDDGWHAFGANPPIPGATNNIGSCAEARLDGLVVLPPGGQFNISAIAPVATATSIQIGVRWYEVQL